jgi:uncharacterized membrane protein
MFLNFRKLTGEWPVFRTPPEPAAYSRSFACFGLVAVLLLAFITPPYQVPDEINHFKRAEQVSRGGLIGQSINSTSNGGAINSGIDTSASKVTVVISNPQVKVTAEMLAIARAATWSSPVLQSEFTTTAAYPPFFYLPAAAGIWVGKILDYSIIDTLSTSRALSGVISVAIGVFAISKAGVAAPWIFVLLLLPMSLAQMASVSQDGPMIALAALAAAIFSDMHLGDRPRPSNRCQFIAMCVIILLVAMARPTNSVLVVLPLLSRGHSRAARLLGAAGILAGVAIWMQIAPPIQPYLKFGSHADYVAQLEFLRANPAALFGILARSAWYFTPQYFESFVGRLGWGDVELPRAYHACASIALFVAALAVMAGSRHRVRLIANLLIAGALGAGVLAMMVILYVMWTPPRIPFVVGLQGRYLIPLAMFLAAALPSLGRYCSMAPLVGHRAFVLLWGFSPITIVVTIAAIVRRYYI